MCKEVFLNVLHGFLHLILTNFHAVGTTIISTFQIKKNDILQIKLKQLPN